MESTMQKEIVKIPDLGANVHVAEILIKVGESVTKDQPIAVLESDKASVELVSPISGKIVDLCAVLDQKMQTGEDFCGIEIDVQQSTEVSSVEDRSPQSESSDSKSQFDSHSTTQLTGQSPTQQWAEQLFELPDLGGNTTHVAEIHKKVGDKVTKDEVVMSLESDKAMMDVPAPQSGTIQAILCAVGEEVTAGQEWLKLTLTHDPGMTTKNKYDNIESTDRAVSSNAKSIASEAITQSESSPYSGEVAAGPKVRQLAREWGVVLQQVSGSGYKGRITENDLKTFVQQRLTGQAGASHEIEKAKPKVIEHDFTAFGKVTKEPQNRIKQIAAKHLTKSWQIPQVTQFFDADFTKLETTGKASKQIFAEQGARLTPMVFIIKALIAVMKQYPKFNASLSIDEKAIFIKEYYHIGFAVDTPQGLVVAVVHNADQKSHLALAHEIVQLSTKARDVGLSPAEMQGGCMTISSLGGIGGAAFTPIVNSPEVAIIGVGKGAMQPVYHDGKFEPRYLVPMALSYDHRVIDGADAARFAVAFQKEIIQMGHDITIENILGES